MACGAQSLLAQACVSKDMTAFSHGFCMFLTWVNPWLVSTEEAASGRARDEKDGQTQLNSLATVCLAVLEVGTSHPGFIK